MARFGDTKSRKEVHEGYLRRGGSNKSFSLNEDGTTNQFIGNVNSLSSFDEGKAGNFITNPPPSPDNLQWSKNLTFLKDYFKSRNDYYFKYGMQVANATDNANRTNLGGSIEALDEDPIIFGFDFVINKFTSPLFTELPSFFNFASSNGINEVANRATVYNDFMDQLELLFLTTAASEFDTFKGHYLINVSGLENLIAKGTDASGSDKQFAEFGKDKITLTLREDSQLSGGYLTALYKTLTYSKLNGKQLIPGNLLRFDCSIIISEIRNYKYIQKVISEGGREVVSVFNDNISRYIYNLYDCQFVLDKHSHPNSISNTDNSVTESFDLDFNYKFSALEMQKFKYQGDGSEFENRKKLNEAGINPRKRLQGSVDPDSGFVDLGYKRRDNPIASYDVVKDNGIVENLNVESENADEIRNLRNSSIEASVQRQKEELQRIQDENPPGNTGGLTKSEENRIGDYSDAESRAPGLRGQDLSEEESGLQGFVNRSKRFAGRKAREARGRLINDTIQNIRTATGIRRISAPVNVYTQGADTIPDFLKRELSNFANDSVTDFLGNINNS